MYACMYQATLQFVIQVPYNGAVNMSALINLIKCVWRQFANVNVGYDQRQQTACLKGWLGTCSFLPYCVDSSYSFQMWHCSIRLGDAQLVRWPTSSFPSHASVHTL